MNPTHLYSKFLAGTCSEEELQQLLNHFANHGEHSPLATDITAMLEDDSIPEDPVFRRMLDKVLLQTDSYVDAMLHEPNATLYPAQAAVKTKIYRLKYYIAAAALLFFMFASYLIWKQNLLVDSRPTQAANAITKFTPGKDKAILTLADGQQVVLDADKRDTVSLFGKTQLLNNQEGLQIMAGNADHEADHAINNLTTPNGTQYRIVLADGTKVWLNAGSSLKFPAAFSGKNRQVELTGEAYFEVAHRKNQPFTVALPDLKVEVLGTHFNVKAYSNDQNIETTLLQGAVKVNNGTNELFLQPGQQSQYDKANGNLKRTIPEEASTIVAWKNGLFSFENTDIKEVLKQLSRWYTIEVVFRGGVPNRKFSGGFERQTSLEQVIKILNESNINCKLQDNKLVIYN
ncbi:FecR family protein [Sphingobacterium ginsenosidimutans]|uniref:FecR family protein n=1 Tax=Sphingobacterium ginsenosidimutans TaxID=687845 RepID=A0ABP8A5V6_9SPHI